jgi:hypothetical protein
MKFYKLSMNCTQIGNITAGSKANRQIFIHCNRRELRADPFAVSRADAPSRHFRILENIFALLFMIQTGSKLALTGPFC